MNRHFANGARMTQLMRRVNIAGKATLWGLLALTPMSGKAQTAPAQPLHVHNIVLVHGAWADGSSWNKIIPLLKKRGSMSQQYIFPSPRSLTMWPRSSAH